jgi:hypothetical protein
MLAVAMCAQMIVADGTRIVIVVTEDMTENAAGLIMTMIAAVQAGLAVEAVVLEERDDRIAFATPWIETAVILTAGDKVAAVLLFTI